MDATHALHHLASQVVVDENFVEALLALHKQFRIFTDFFDQSHSWQVIQLLLSGAENCYEPLSLDC